MGLKKGDKVICVDDNLTHPEWILKGVVRNGSIYTIRSIDGVEGDVRLMEVKQIIHLIALRECVFFKSRFRKLWDNKQLLEMDNKIKETIEV